MYYRKCRQLLLLAVIAACVVGTQSRDALGADVFWQSSVSGNWNDPSKWSGGNVPGVNDDVFITTSGTFIVTVNQVVNVQSITLGASSGTQTLQSNGFDIQVAAPCLIGTQGSLQLSSTALDGGATSILSFGSILMQSATLNIELINQGALTAEENGTGLNVFDQSFTNTSSGSITLQGTLGNNAGLRINNGGNNEGLIELTSNDPGSDAGLEMQVGLFTNVTGAVIRALAGSGGGRTIVCGAAAQFVNNGTVDIRQDLQLDNDASVENSGLFLATGATLNIVNSSAFIQFTNRGSLLTTSAGIIAINGGSFVASSGTLSGDGFFGLSNLVIEGGVLRVDQTVLQLNSCTLEFTAELSNSGVVECINNNNFFGPSLVATSAVLRVFQPPSGTAQLQLFGQCVNNGIVELTSVTTALISSSKIIIQNSTFVNNGDLLVTAPSAPLQADRIIELKESRFIGSGSLIVSTNSTMLIDSEDSLFDISDGSIRVFSNARLVFDDSIKTLTSPPSVTVGSISIFSTSAQVHFGNSSSATLFKLGETPTTSLIHVEGELHISGGELTVHPSAIVQGPGDHFFRNLRLRNNMTLQSTNGNFVFSDCHLLTTASLTMHGNVFLESCNVFDGQLLLATSCVTTIRNPLPLPPDIGAIKPFQLLSSQSFVNNGTFIFNQTIAPASVFVSSGLLQNNGTIRIATIASRSVIFVTSNVLFVNSTGAFISASSNTQPIRIVATNAIFRNHGQVVFANSQLTASSKLIFLQSSTFANSGIVRFRNFATTSTILLGNNTRFVNTGTVEFDQNRTGAHGALVFRNPLELCNDGTLEYRNYATSASLLLSNATHFKNGGNLLFRNFVTSASLTLSSNALFTNNGRVQFCSFATTASIILGDNSRWNNNTNSAIEILTTATALLRLTSSHVFVNSGRILVQNATNAIFHCGSSSVFTNNANGVLDIRGARKTGTLRLFNSSQMINRGTFRFRNFATTATIFLGDNTRWTNHTGSTLKVQTTAGIFLRLTNSHVFVNSGEIALQRATNAIMFHGNSSVFDNKATGVLDIRRVHTTGTLRLFDSSQMINRGVLRFRNFATTARIFLGDNTRWTNHTGSVLRIQTTAGIFLRLTNAHTFVNSGDLLIENATNAIFRGGNSAAFNNGATGTIDIRGARDTGGLRLFDSSEIDNRGTFRFRNFATTATIFLGDATRWTNHTGSVLSAQTTAGIFLRLTSSHVFVNSGQILLQNATNAIFHCGSSSVFTNGANGELDIRGASKTGTLRLFDNSEIDNRGTFRFRNFATTATIFLGDATRWTNHTGSALRVQTTAGIFLGLTNSHVMVNDGTILLRNSSNSNIRLENNSLFIISTGGQVDLTDSRGSGSLRLSSNAQITNSGTFRFRNFATTATIFLGDAARWHNNVNGIVEFDSTGGKGGIDLRGQSTFDNDGTFRFRNFATTATIFLGDVARWNNNTNATTIFDGTRRTMKLQMASNAIINNSGTFRFRNFATTATIFLGDATRWNNKSGGLVEFDSTGGRSAIDLFGQSIVDNSGTFRFRNFATTATIFLGDATRWENKSGGLVEYDSTGRRSAIELFGQSIVDNDGTFRFRNFATTATIFLGDAARWNNNTNATTIFDSTQRRMSLKLASNATFNNSGTFRFRNFATTATIFLGDATRWQNNANGKVEFDSTGGKSRIELRNQSTFDNKGSCQFKHFASTATIFLGEATRWNNNANSELKFDSTGGKSRIELRNQSTFDNKGSCQFKHFASTATIFLGEATRWINSTSATTVFDSTQRSMRLQLASNATFNNSGTFRFRNVATKATIELKDDSQLTNSTGAIISFTTIAGVACINSSGRAIAVNFGKIQFRSLMSSAAFVQSDFSQWRFMTNSTFEFDSTGSHTALRLFDSSQLLNSGSLLYRQSFTSCVIRLDDQSCFNNEDGGNIFCDTLPCPFKWAQRGRSKFCNDGMMRFNRPDSLITFEIGDTAAFANKSRMQFRHTDTRATVNFCPIRNGLCRNEGAIDALTVRLIVLAKNNESKKPETQGFVSSTTAIYRTDADGQVIFQDGFIQPNGTYVSTGGTLRLRNNTVTNALIKLDFDNNDGKVEVEETAFVGEELEEFSAPGRPFIVPVRRTMKVPVCLDLIGRSTIATQFTNSNVVVFKPNTSGIIDTRFLQKSTNANIWKFNVQGTQITVSLPENDCFNNLGKIFVDSPVTSVTFKVGTNGQFFQKNLLVITSAVCNVFRMPNARFDLSTTSILELDNGELNLLPFSREPYIVTTHALIRGSGTLNLGNVRNNGRISPGSSAGLLVLPGDLEQSSDASLDIEIGGTSAGLTFDKIVADDVTLGGALNVSLIDGFVPEIGDRFVFMEYNSVRGTFATVNYINVSNANLVLEVGSTSAALVAVSTQASVLDLSVYLQGYWTGSFHRQTPIMLELRTGATLIASTLHNRSTVLLTTHATASLTLDNVAEGDYWLVLRHGGHLAIGSASTFHVAPGTTTAVDFTQQANVFNGVVSLPTITIGGQNFNVVRTGDFNANGDVGADDFIKFFVPNFGISNPGQVPLLD